MRIVLSPLRMKPAYLPLDENQRTYEFVARVLESIVSHHATECYPSDDIHCTTDLIGDKDGNICLVLSTGNKWCANLRKRTITYEGSRFGFWRGDGAPLRLEVRPHPVTGEPTIYGIHGWGENKMEMELYIEDYETSTPEEWRVEPWDFVIRVYYDEKAYDERLHNMLWGGEIPTPDEVWVAPIWELEEAGYDVRGPLDLFRERPKVGRLVWSKNQKMAVEA